MAELNKVKKGDRYGYVNAEGNLIFDYIFENGVDTFGSDSYRSTPYATIIKNGSIGIINEEGETIIPAEYDDAFHLFGEFFAVRKVFSTEDESGHKTHSYRMGVLNKNLETIIPFEFDYISSKGSFFECYTEAECTNGISFSLSGRRYQYHPRGDAKIYDSAGILARTGIIRSADEKYFVLEDDRKVGVCNNKGELIIPQVYKDIQCCGNDMFIVESGDCREWSFSILDCNNTRITDKDYKYIKPHKGIFFECYRSAERESGYNNSVQYTGCGAAIWLNAAGVELHVGNGVVLSSKYLRAENAHKFGIIDNQGNKILNFQYDFITIDGEYFIVEYNKSVGIIKQNSELIVNPIYNEIEFVNIGEYSETVQRRNQFNYRVPHTLHGKYSPITPYDSESDSDQLAHHIIKAGELGKFTDFDYSNTLILRTETYAELYSIKDGLIENGRFDSIQQITNISFVVRKEGKYGVFRIDTKQLVVSCEYERIIFEGNHSVLMQKGSKWGAKSLVLPSHPLYSKLNVDIECEFDEIFFCSPEETYFCVKNPVKNWDGDIHDAFFIVDNTGHKPYEMLNMPGYQSKIVYYGNDRLLTSLNGKYGFIGSMPNIRG